MISVVVTADGVKGRLNRIGRWSEALGKISAAGMAFSVDRDPRSAAVAGSLAVQNNALHLLPTLGELSAETIMLMLGAGGASVLTWEHLNSMGSPYGKLSMGDKLLLQLSASMMQQSAEARPQVESFPVHEGNPVPLITPMPEVTRWEDVSNVTYVPEFVDLMRDRGFTPLPAHLTGPRVLDTPAFDQTLMPLVLMRDGGGRSGRQLRLRELANDDKLGSADRGWIQQELNSIARRKRTDVRNPPGNDLAHRRGYEAAKGFDYSYSYLQNRDLHRLQHKFDDFGRKNKTPDRK